MNKLAKEYSEGSDELYNCLINLWKNNFETIGCCIGHNGHRQYIGLNRIDNEAIIKLLSILNKDNIIISFLNNHVSIKKYKDIDIYNNILNSLEIYIKGNNIAIDKNIVEAISFIDNNSYEYVNIHYYYKNGLLEKYINTSDLKLINKLKDRYEYTVLNKKLNMYHFIIK